MNHSIVVKEKSELEDAVADKAATKVLEKDDATDTKDVVETLPEVVTRAQDVFRELQIRVC